MGKFVCSLLFAFVFANNLVAQSVDLVDFVNPLMGTASRPDMSNGNTYPAVSTPWAMNMWTPQTGKNGNGWQYVYTADKIRGFKQTHQPSPWMNDYGVFSLMPVHGAPIFKEEERQSWFSHKSEISRPDYYSVYLADHHISTEMTTTERSAIMRFTMGYEKDNYVVIDAFDKGSFVKIIPAENKVVGYSKRYARGSLIDFASYFVIEFNQPFSFTKVWQEEALLDSLFTTGNHSGAIVGFKMNGSNGQVVAKISSSFISLAQAEINLKREIGNQSFEQIRAKSNRAWNDVLGKVKIEGGSEDQKRTFYSCLYRTALFPNKMYELDSAGNMMHYSPYNGKILPGYMYAGTGFWDTFRALYPLLNLLYPSVNAEMQEGLVNDFKEGGFLPEWSSPGYANIMIGNNSASVVADAFIKGGKGYDISTLYTALQHGAANVGPVEAVGRFGVNYYNALGYVPYDVNVNENVARTLEYAYDDFSIYKLAEKLGRPAKEIEVYAQRSLNYRNVFDAEKKLMRGRKKDGSFQSPFDPFKWGDAFTEGNSWHYTWSVFHDIKGLMELMGGKKQFVTKLDSVFSMPPIFNAEAYGGTIHEMREMQVANMGQYAHGNQPIQHATYLFNHAGESYKTQYWVRETLNRMYQPTPDGYCGDEDNGQTSAWYVFSALGFYPVTPAVNQYVLGAPLFKKATLSLENGKKFVISAANFAPNNRFISAQKLFGKSYTKTFISHQDILKGGTFEATMSAFPDTNRITTSLDLPYSFSKDDVTIYNSVKGIKAAGLASMMLNKPDTISKNGLALFFIDEENSFSAALKEKFVNMYFTQYPKLYKKYNPESPKEVTFLIDKSYGGVAAANKNTVRFNPVYFNKNKEDLDAITHELMHLVQQYGDTKAPSWVTEGIADFVRGTYGINNVAGKWKMPDLTDKHQYDNSYRVTARFLVWITQQYDPEFVTKLDSITRNKNYNDDTWKNLTGKTVLELWAEYKLNPGISFSYQ